MVTTAHNHSDAYSDTTTNPISSDYQYQERQMQYYASLAQCISDAVISTDMNFNIVSWNDAALIGDLLNISKIQAGQLEFDEEAFDFDEFVREMVENAQQTSKTHTIVVSGALHREIVGDKDRIGQVLVNLLTNAIKYSPEADRVNVRIRADEQDVIVSVQDYGVGIAQEHKDKIFERFYRVYDERDKTFPGLGIGLYVSYQIVKRHGGNLWVESREGEGSTFYFSLPLPRSGSEYD